MRERPAALRRLSICPGVEGHHDRKRGNTRIAALRAARRGEPAPPRPTSRDCLGSGDRAHRQVRAGARSPALRARAAPRVAASRSRGVSRGRRSLLTTIGRRRYPVVRVRDIANVVSVTQTVPVEWTLLEGLPSEDVRRLLAIAWRRTFRKGEVVFHRDDLAESLHLIVKGQARPCASRHSSARRPCWT